MTTMREVSEGLALCQQSTGPLWVGLDAHKSSCTVAAYDDHGDEVAAFQFATTRAQLELFASAMPAQAQVALEASTTGKAVYRLLRDAPVNVHMAGPMGLG